MAEQWSETVVAISAGDLPHVVWDDRPAIDWPVRLELPRTSEGQTTVYFDDPATYRRWLLELTRDWYLRFGDGSDLAPQRPAEPELVDELGTPMAYGMRPETRR